jgi:glycosyltransferase involved in cell wall biosynthesis
MAKTDREGSISVVIPVYNAQEFLGAALDSVFSQTRSPHEVIVVDDCSTDDSTAIARRYPVKLVTPGRKLWTGGARTLGLEQALGDYYAVLDSDDFWESSHLATVAAALDADSRIVASFSAAQQLGGNDQVLRPSLPIGLTQDPSAIAFRRMPAVHSTMIARAAALRRVGGYPIGTERHWADDFHAVLNLSTQGAFYCTHDITAYYRIHTNQMSTQEWRQCRDAYASRAEFAKTFASPSFPARVLLSEVYARDVNDALTWTQDEVLETLAEIGARYQLTGPVQRWTLRGIARALRLARRARSGTWTRSLHSRNRRQ